jgi:tape measure domain-containing protein
MNPSRCVFLISLSANVRGIFLLDSTKILKKYNMATKSKLELIMELSDKLFNNKLSQVSAKLGIVSDKMQGKLNQLKMPQIDTGNIEKLSSLNLGIGAGIGMAVVSTVTSGISELSTEAVSSVDALTKFNDTMKFAGFDPTAINTAKDALKKYADQTVYDLTTTSNTVAQLAANGIENYMELTQAAGNLNAVAGGNADTFKSVAMVLTQTAGAGKLTTENWNQLANAIPGASGKLQEALLKNGAFTGNFRKAMEDGQISALEFNKALIDLGNTPIAVEAAKSTKTFEGAIGQLKAGVVDTFSNILAAIGIDNLTSAINTLGSVVQTALQPFLWFFNELKEGNSTLEFFLGIIGALTVGFLAYQTVVGSIILATKIWAEAQALLNGIMMLNPIGLIIAAIVTLVAFVAIAITKWDKWGAALMVFLGPVGMVISAFKSLYDHWDSIVQAFKSDGILAGLKRIGVVILDAILKPLQQVLETIGLDSWASGIADIRKSLDLVTLGEKQNVTSKGVNPNTDPFLKYNQFGPQPAPNPLLKAPGFGTKPGSDKKNKKTGENISKVAGQANQVRNTTINIDAFNKGGINVAQSAYSGMSKDDIEAWFKEMLRRLVINAETV